LGTIDLLTIITIAFLGSFGHCIGMCGGIVLAYSSAKIDSNWNKLRQSLSHILYSIGRITTYTVLGAIFGYIGGVATFSHIANGILFFITGMVMILTGLSLLGKIKFLSILEHSISNSIWYQTIFKDLVSSNTLFSFYFIGLLNGLLPCGFVYFFAITAASTASSFYGAIIMLIFGISTIPALFSVGFFVSIFKKTKLRSIFIKIASILVIIYGLHTMFTGYKFVIDPSRTILQCHSN